MNKLSSAPSIRPFILRLVSTGAIFAATCASLAQTAKPRILQAVDEKQLVVLSGNTPAPALDARNDRGAVPDSLPLEHLRLVLPALAR